MRRHLLVLRVRYRKQDQESGTSRKRSQEPAVGRGRTLGASPVLPPAPSPFPPSKVLKLQPLQHEAEGRNQFVIQQHGPVPARDVWSEVPMVELPRLLRIMMGDNVGTVATREQFLVQESDEMLVMHCWRRVGLEGDGERVCGRTVNGVRDASLEMEQLLWYDAVAALGETAPCAESPVPAGRVRLAPAGVATREELLDEAPSLAPLALLRKYVKPDLFGEELGPRLFPHGSGTVRVLTAALEMEKPGRAASGGAGRPAPMPKTLDDLFRDDVDFRVPAPWKATGDVEEEDPLKRHTLNSVFLSGEQAGFLFAFHCLQAIDPCAF